MKPLEAMIRDIAKKAAEEMRFSHLTRSLHVQMHMERNRSFWSHITFNTLPEGDERGRMMHQLLITLREADLSQCHVDHCLVDEDEAPRKESKLRCKFWNDLSDIVVSTVKYAVYCGYITFDEDAIEKENDEIESKYEAMKPSAVNEQQ